MYKFYVHVRNHNETRTFHFDSKTNLYALALKLERWEQIKLWTVLVHCRTWVNAYACAVYCVQYARAVKQFSIKWRDAIHEFHTGWNGSFDKLAKYFKCFECSNVCVCVSSKIERISFAQYATQCWVSDICIP